MMKYIVLLLISLNIVFAQITVNYKANTNVTLANGNDFKYRKTVVTDLSIPYIYNALFVSSVSLEVTPGTANYDALFGSAYAGAGNPPSAYIAYFDSMAKWTATGNYGNASVNSAEGFVGSVYISLDEVTASGSVVQTIALKSLGWTVEDKSVGNGGLRYETFKGSLTGSFVVHVTYVLSDVVGVLDVTGNGIVTPKSLESIIEIDNFPYQSTQNSVRLNIGVGTASASLSAQGSVTQIVTGNGQAAAYFTVDSTAQINGAATKVSISSTAAGQAATTFGNSALVGQVNGKYGASADFKIVTVTFPAGATKIVLDPSIGAGSAPPTAAVGKLVPSLVLIFAALVKLFM